MGRYPSAKDGRTMAQVAADNAAWKQA